MALIYTLIDKDEVIIKEEKTYENNLFTVPIYLEIDNKDNKTRILESKLDRRIIHIIKYAYLSNNKDKEVIIYKFIKASIKYESEVIYHRNIDSVNQILAIANYVSREAHRMKGFLRFKKMNNNFYYGEFSPTNNVISIVSNHFRKRLSGEYFIIKDVARSIYAIYDKKNIYYLNEENISHLNLNTNSSEDEIIGLWKSFYNTIGIKERKNLKCQMNFMPKKYWKYIVEVENETSN